MLKWIMLSMFLYNDKYCIRLKSGTIKLHNLILLNKSTYRQNNIQNDSSSHVYEFKKWYANVFIAYQLCQLVIQSACNTESWVSSSQVTWYIKCFYNHINFKDTWYEYIAWLYSPDTWTYWTCCKIFKACAVYSCITLKIIWC